MRTGEEREAEREAEHVHSVLTVCFGRRLSILAAKASARVG
jgi:hypothetical protein